ncbi:MAG: bifunctional phosphopantothenoylcysteine decarboxylase/phosphopantothenate--cysteine ligase CoaBC, partial [Candidatus Hydrogenedentes bacterium]|nr:bifunctional phosphopantothenoylcysteine decarboxylase/phosphopantothenate--cysteine ligase CoaBC [Candidatus Hydrogenedentota bacterium]
MRRHISNKEVVLAVTGSIAAYKACEIASRLVELDAKVTPVLTRSACELVQPATFEAITGRRAITAMFAPFANPEIEHIAVATRAHLFLVAPATANILAKAANGIADDWLSTALLATRAPILFAPAMNSNMFAHPATQANIATLRGRGCHFIEPESGRLACGTVGQGRMADPMSVIEATLPLISSDNSLDGKKVLITSGGTREPIDPVRYVGNRSSGKMGRALAIEALARGAQVTVVTGPSDIALPYGVEIIRVETAMQMADETLPRAQEADIVICAAAVADYRPEQTYKHKRKRTGQTLVLTLVENPDILAQIGAAKREGQILVGFAAETEELVANAGVKLDKKNLDLIIANQVGVPESGFGVDTLNAAILDRDGQITELPLIAKDELAQRLFDRIENKGQTTN